MQQELTLTQAIQAAVSAAEEDALPVLREACLAAITGDRDAAITAERLTRELGIDCRDSGHQRTTRAQQALETLQEVLLSLRTGRLKTEPPVLGTANPAAGWELAFDPDKPYVEQDFDEEWLWMGGYGTWNAAIPCSPTRSPTCCPSCARSPLQQHHRGHWTRPPPTSS